MAEFASHELLGEYARLQFSEAVKETINRQPAAYFYGLQGPDPLFYHAVAAGRPLHKLGNRMHSESTAALFHTMAQAAMRLTGTRAQIAQAYLYGFLGHYALDSALHPYVYYLQYTTMQKDPKVHPSAVHCGIESDMESAIYQHKTGKLISTYAPDARYQLTEEQEAVMAVLLQHVLKKVYKVEVSTNRLRASFGDMMAIQRMFYACTPAARNAVARTERIIGKGAVLSARLKVDEPQWDCLNLQRKPWHHLWQPDLKHYENGLEMFDTAVRRTVQLANEYGEQFQNGWLCNISFYAPFDDGNWKALRNNLLPES